MKTPRLVGAFSFLLRLQGLLAGAISTESPEGAHTKVLVRKRRKQQSPCWRLSNCLPSSAALPVSSALSGANLLNTRGMAGPQPAAYRNKKPASAAGLYCKEARSLHRLTGPIPVRCSGRGRHGLARRLTLQSRAWCWSARSAPSRSADSAKRRSDRYSGGRRFVLLRGMSRR